jgi:hypothetical protein
MLPTCAGGLESSSVSYESTTSIEYAYDLKFLLLVKWLDIDYNSRVLDVFGGWGVFTAFLCRHIHCQQCVFVGYTESQRYYVRQWAALQPAAARIQVCTMRDFSKAQQHESNLLKTHVIAQNSMIWLGMPLNVISVLMRYLYRQLRRDCQGGWLYAEVLTVSDQDVTLTKSKATPTADYMVSLTTICRLMGGERLRLHTLQQFLDCLTAAGFVLVETRDLSASMAATCRSWTRNCERHAVEPAISKAFRSLGDHLLDGKLKHYALKASNRC